MSENIPPPSRPGRNDPWRLQRMVQRVPAHLGETSHEAVSPWLIVGGIFLLIIIACGVIYIVIGGRLSSLPFGTSATPTRTRTIGPPVTIVPVTLPPASPTPGPTAATIKYRVKPGENLTIIAERYHVSIRAIMQANNLNNADSIRSGDELIIPLPTPTPPSGG